jgi:hypothetical protein
MRDGSLRSMHGFGSKLFSNISRLRLLSSNSPVAEGIFHLSGGQYTVSVLMRTLYPVVSDSRRASLVFPHCPSPSSIFISLRTALIDDSVIRMSRIHLASPFFAIVEVSTVNPFPISHIDRSIHSKLPRATLLRHCDGTHSTMYMYTSCHPPSQCRRRWSDGVL